MPANPTFATNRTTANTAAEHLSDHNGVHTIIDAIYKAVIGATRTAAFTVTQAQSGEVTPVSVTASVAVTVPVLEQGTSVELVQTNTAGFTLTASGVTFVPAAGGAPRAQGSSVSLLWLTATSVLVGGDLL